MNLNKLIIGYIAIFLVYFLFKSLIFHGLVIKKGVVVDNRYFVYSGLKNRNSTRSYYPIVVFEGPSKQGTMELRDKNNVKSDSDTSISTFINNQASSDGNNESSGQNAPDTGNLYVTQPPIGSLMSKEYHIGDSVNVFYENEDIKNAKVLTLSSYWLTLPAFCILFLSCIIWTGVLRFTSIKD